MVSVVNGFWKEGSFGSEKRIKYTKIADLFLLSLFMNSNVVCKAVNVWVIFYFQI